MNTSLLNTGILLFVALLNCKSTRIKNEQTFLNTEQITGYNFSAPDLIVKLPLDLYEISGLTPIDTTTFACIQDEKGALFIYDLVTNEIKNENTFYSKGDFEDIARVGKAMYILRSNATLFEIADYESKPTEATSFILPISAWDNEGLCYDRDHDRLLIASKGNTGKGSELKNIRDIYGFDLKKRELIETPVYKFDERILKQFALDNKINVPVKQNKKGETEPDIKFRPTAIGIHPLTKKLFLLSAPDFMLFIFSSEGTIEHIEILNPELFDQAEGLAFLENGDLLITNEGQLKNSTLLRFNYRKK